MRTRGGCCYPSSDGLLKSKRKQQIARLEVHRKRPRSESDRGLKVNHFDGLPDDLLVSILAKLSARAKCPADFMNVILTCKRFNALGMHPLVLLNASTGAFGVKSASWSDGAHNFMKKCADAGNIEACYTLGMVLIG